jgi:hypothetical protein
MKRYFKINTGRYGGELTVGEIEPQYVDYWQDKFESNEADREDLVESIINFEWEDEQTFDDVPRVTKDFCAWNECDDLEHLNGPYDDNQFTVTEIQLHDDAEYTDGAIQWIEDCEHDYSVDMYTELEEIGQYDYPAQVYSRECFTQHIRQPDITEPASKPVMMFHSSEKGGFGDIYVETNNCDFDPELLQIGIVETDLANIIESYWYDREPLQPDFDCADTIGKSYNAWVGYAITEYHEQSDLYLTYDFSETKQLKEAFDDWYDCQG